VKRKVKEQYLPFFKNNGKEKRIEFKQFKKKHQKNRKSELVLKIALEALQSITSADIWKLQVIIIPI
jgi:hypothetical protein